jgi:hypothetical protein
MYRNLRSDIKTQQKKLEKEGKRRIKRMCVKYSIHHA